MDKDLFRGIPLVERILEDPRIEKARAGRSRWTRP
jgi:hypothetical protein